LIFRCKYIQPTDAAVLSQAELLVIDEAAAIPLPIVKSLLGPYLVFMASTINGYEGTGRSLSIKLFAQLREQSVSGNAASTIPSADGKVVSRDGKERKEGGGVDASTGAPPSARVLREIKLDEPIRYSVNDPVEAWLTKLLCLDACNPSASTITGHLAKSSLSGCPHPDECELYYVNRDTLFSYHPVSEAFLQRMMGLYVASHYKNSPNDLQLMSDAPAHHLFVLLPPLNTAKANTLPEPLVVIQVCLEGNIAQKSALSSLARGIRSSGDLIPWVVAQQFQDDDFASLSGARIVRVASHPDFVGMGYGSVAMKKLKEYYSGSSVNGGVSINEDDDGAEVDGKYQVKRVSDEELQDATLATDEIKVRDPTSMPPLLLRLSERPPKEHLHWIGVSYGLTPQLHKFWKKQGYVPVYLRQTTNELTGEHTCIMLAPLKRGMKASTTTIALYGDGKGDGDNESEAGWVHSFSWDFRRRLVELLSYQFKKFGTVSVLSLLEACEKGKPSDLGESKYWNPF
jgi:N-acetyltransferase 10